MTPHDENTHSVPCVTYRPTVPALEDLLYKPIPILDHGFIYPIDYMGDDTAITSAARVSYGRGTKRLQEDTNLIRYMLRHEHATPFEMPVIKFHVKLPIFVARQWIRHRASCLAGDVKLTFDLPGGILSRGNKIYYLTIKEIYDRFQPTVNVTRPDKQKYPYFNRDHVRGMMLRSCDEMNLWPTHTSIVDVWESGVKPIYRVDFGQNKILRASADHLCFTDLGWLRLIDALQSNAGFATTVKSGQFISYTPEFTTEDERREEWRSLPSCPKYEVSNMGRVRSLLNNQNNPRQYPKIKEQTYVPNGYLVVSLSENGISRIHHVHQLVMETFYPESRDGREVRHHDDNRANNRLDNLLYGTPFENTSDRMNGDGSQRMAIGFTAPISYIQDGEEMTYDLSVSGPFHNFCAGGVYVHNSYNEYSARYSILDKEFYIPEFEKLATQSTSNRQGRGDVLQGEEADAVLTLLRDDANRNYDHYIEMLNEGEHADPNRDGLARELARMNLTLNTYTQWYWKIDLRNLFHFLGLRAEAHAQYEIRVYAEQILQIVQAWVPIATHAFMDYQFHAIKVSRMEKELLRDMLQARDSWNCFLVDHAGNTDTIAKKYGLTKREMGEFIQNLGLQTTD